MKPIKAILTSPINAISDSPYSHRSAQAEIYASQIRNFAINDGTELDLTVNYGNKETDFDQYDVILVYHGNDWSGALNLFGGPGAIKNKVGLVSLLKNQHKCQSLVIDMPDYAGLLRKRLKDGQTFGNELDELPEKTVPAVSALSPSFENTNKLVVGDSHAISMYRPGFDVLSVPFKTLFGFLKENPLEFISSRFPQHQYENFDTFEFYFGNIDIRHHLCRFTEGKERDDATDELARRYVEAVASIRETIPNASLKIMETMPCESEDRVLPKTGYYKGLPFYGSWNARMDVRRRLNDAIEANCQKHSIAFDRWSQYLENEKGELDQAHMERPRSVHLARASYPYWTGPIKKVKELAKPKKKAASSVEEVKSSLEGFFSE